MINNIINLTGKPTTNKLIGISNNSSKRNANNTEEKIFSFLLKKYPINKPRIALNKII